MKKILVLFCVIIWATGMPGQIKIKERVEIAEMPSQNVGNCYYPLDEYCFDHTLCVNKTNCFDIEGILFEGEHRVYSGKEKDYLLLSPWGRCTSSDYFDKDWEVRIISGNQYATLYKTECDYITKFPYVVYTKVCSSNNASCNPGGAGVVISFNGICPIDNGIVILGAYQFGYSSSPPDKTVRITVLNPKFRIEPLYENYYVTKGAREWVSVMAEPRFEHLINLSDSIKYRAEIIYGEKYGELVYQDQRGRQVDGMDHESGQLTDLYFDAYGTDVYNGGEAKIRISTTDAHISPIEIKIQVLPVPLRVSINPSEVLPGNTAEIIIEKYDTLGKAYMPITGFDEKLEAGILEGCMQGELLTNQGLTGNYFKDITLPLKFRANADAEEAEVRIRVGLYKEYELPACEIAGGKDSVFHPALKYDRRIEKKYEVTDESCGIYEFEYNNFWDVAIAEVGCGCDKYSCNNAGYGLEVPDFNLKWFTLGEDFCQGTVVNGKTSGGYFKFWNRVPDRTPQQNLVPREGYDFYEDIDVYVCYNRNSAKWNYKINDNNKINIRYKMAVCESNFTNLNQGYVFIRSLDDLSSIPAGEMEKALRDFEEQKTYDNWAKVEKYVIVNALWGHEKKHRSDFQEILSKTRKHIKEKAVKLPHRFDIFGEIICQMFIYPFPCGKATPLIVQSILKEQFKCDMDNFHKILTDSWGKRTGRYSDEKSGYPMGGAANLAYENKTQEEAAKIIELYIERLIKIKEGSKK